MKLYSLAHTLLLNVFSGLKGTHFYILFAVVGRGSFFNVFVSTGVCEFFTHIM